jgi:hypothetical protein
MITIEDLSNIIDNNSLQELFNSRNTYFFSQISAKDKKNIKAINIKKNKSREKLECSLNNIPSSLSETRKIIDENLENYIENVNIVNSYFDEKIYKTGVLDGIFLMMEFHKLYN